MKLLVLGASGGCGKEVVKQAVARGLSVTAVARGSSGYTPSEGVQLAKGNVLDKEFIKEVVKDQFNIISCLGIKRSNAHNPWSKLVSPENFTQQVVSTIIEATGNTPETSLAVISAAGVGDSFNHTFALMKFMIQNSNIGVAYNDLGKMEDLLSESNLNWLAVRPVTLTNGSGKKNVRLTDSYKPTSMISRANVAKWMLDQIERKEQFKNRIQMITE